VKIAQIAAASAALLFLLTWLAVHGTTTVPRESEMAMRAIDAITAAERALHRAVLAARTGILRDYDPLVAEIAAMRAAIDDLSRIVPEGINDAESLQKLTEIVDRKEAWTEEFKSQNALLQNSLAQFNLFSMQLSAPGHAPILGQQVSGLATAMLQLTLDTSPRSVAIVEARMRRIGLDGLSERDTRTARALLSHARLLQNVLPETDRLVKSIVMLSAAPQQEALADLIRAHAAASEKVADAFRFVLYGASLLLAGLLVLLGIQLQTHARTLRRRANLEHVIADFSTSVINSQSNDIVKNVEAALAGLAQCLGAERAYFIVPSEPAQIFRWSPEGVAFPAGWPLRALDLAGLVGSSPGGNLRASVASTGSDSGVDTILGAAGVQSWLGTASPRYGGPLLGFDILRNSHSFSRRNCALLRMACDAITNALERDHLEREKERLEAGLQRARRMETIGSLASGIAHNFNNIIGAILGYTEMAFAHVSTESGLADNLAEIRRAGERARDIVDQILTFGRRSEVRREAVRMRALLAEAQALLEASLPPGVSLRVRAMAEEVVVTGEPAQLQQVIVNVGSNAAQAIDGVGDVDISVETKAVDARLQVGREELRPGLYAVVAIADCGRGMTEATRERIFDPFFTTREGGNGLGLATVMEIVRQHDGAIEVQSELGAGTRFDIWLPAAPPRRGDTVPCQHKQGADRGTGETVLIIDPNRDDLLRQEEVLAALGYEPVGFVDRESAVAACRHSSERFDAAVICSCAGAASALDLARALSQVTPQLPVLLATASAREFSAPHLAKAGVRELIHLPLESAELASALRRCLPSKPPFEGQEDDRL
jgi:signal transduction histidine kinase